MKWFGSYRVGSLGLNGYGINFGGNNEN